MSDETHETSTAEQTLQSNVDQAREAHLAQLETKTYEDGTTATGKPPLPDLSPDEQARLEAHVAMERESQAHLAMLPLEQLRAEPGMTPNALTVTDAPRVDRDAVFDDVEREPAPPRPEPPDVNMDHQTVVDWVLAELAHLRGELRAAGHEVLP